LNSHDSFSPHAPGLPGPGESVGGYTILRQVGQGGMAVVFEARHQSLGKRVAVKMLLPHHAAHADIARRFVREGEAAAKLNHPHAVDVTDVGKDARGAPYLVMEFLEGEDLASLLERNGKLSVEQTVDILVPVISAIGAAHDLGIVHRDLKPQNIFLARRRSELTPKVVDFGISKVEAESMKLTGTQALLGTPYYMSPEQAQGASNVDARTDQFAIGVMAYECVTGKRPFDGGALYAVLAQIIHGTPTPPSQLVTLTDPTFDQVVTRVLEKQPDLRYRDVRSLGAALLPLASLRTQLSHCVEFGVSLDTDALRRGVRPSGSPELGGGNTPSSARALGKGAARGRETDDPSLSGEAADPRARSTTRLVARSDSATRSSRKLITASLVAVLGLALGGYGLLARRSSPSAQTSSQGSFPRVRGKPPELPAPAAELRLDLRATPEHASLRLDEQPAVIGQLHRVLRADGSEHELVVSAEGYETKTLRIVDRAPEESVVALVPLAVLPPASPPSTRKNLAPTSSPRTTSASRTNAPPTVPTHSPPASVAPATSIPASEPAPKRYGTNGAPIIR